MAEAEKEQTIAPQDLHELQQAEKAKQAAQEKAEWQAAREKHLQEQLARETKPTSPSRMGGPVS